MIKSKIYFNKKRIKRAHKLLDQLLDKCVTGRDYAAVYTFKALCYDEEDKEEQAFAAYEKVLQYDAVNSFAWTKLGMYYLGKNKLEEAQAASANAITFDPKNVHAYINMAACLIVKHEPEQALQYATKAKELDSDLFLAKELFRIANKMIDDEKNVKE